MPGYTLYGADVSYYTGKARAYLDWRGVDYVEELATQQVYRDIILPSVGWPVIPVMKTPDGEIVQDTTDIIEHIEAAEGLSPPAIPDGPVQAFVAQLLQLYADEWLVIPAMHYRWNYNEDWAYQEFGAISAPDRPAPEQYEIGKRNGERFKGALPRWVSRRPLHRRSSRAMRLSSANSPRIWKCIPMRWAAAPRWPISPCTARSMRISIGTRLRVI